MSFDPVSFALGAASGGGGGAGAGGFTLLHATYSEDEESQSVTLPITASELYALMRTSTVVYDYTSGVEGNSTTYVLPIVAAEFGTSQDYGDAYRFYDNQNITEWLEADDPVVFALGGK